VSVGLALRTLRIAAGFTVLRGKAWQKRLVFFSGLLVLRSCWLPRLLHVSAAGCALIRIFGQMAVCCQCCVIVVCTLFVVGAVAADGGIDGANVLTVDVCIAAVDGGVGGANV